MYSSLIEFLKNRNVEYKENYLLKNQSPIRIGGLAKLVVYPKSIDELVKTLTYSDNNNINYKVVGRTSNILFDDNEIKNIIIKTTKIKVKSLAENIICCDCGVLIPVLVKFAMQNNFGGISELSGIPGTVGGSLFGNSGAFQKEISDIFIDGDFYSKSTKSILTLSKKDIDFSYRHSNIGDLNLIFLRGRFLLDYQDKEQIIEETENFKLKRLTSQPYGEPSLGSIFKRNNGIGAGYYIDNCGLKGFCIGDAEISRKHAGFIVNKNHATSKEVRELIEEVKIKVKVKYGISLEEEIEIYRE